MNTLNIKKSIVVIWLAVVLSFGTGLAGVQLGLDSVNSTHACGLNGGSGGGC